MRVALPFDWELNGGVVLISQIFEMSIIIDSHFGRYFPSLAISFVKLYWAKIYWFYALNILCMY